MSDIRPSDGWLYNVSTGTIESGTPAEITMDRFRAVFPNTTKAWRKVTASNSGCTGNPCDPPEAQIGWGADRLTYFAEEQTWVTPLMCFDQQMHITHAEQHLSQIISDILKPATTAISSNFLRKRALFWGKGKYQCNKTMPQFTYTWTLGGLAGDEEIYFDCSVDPNNVFKLVPQMLQSRFEPLMRIGYGGQNPFEETAPFIELVTDIATCWELDRLGGQTGVGGTPSVTGNWRFEQWSSANKYWRYGYSGQIGNFMVRTDPMGLRFNFVRDLGPGSAPNRYRYQIVLPYRNGITSGAGGAAGLGSDENPDFDKAQFCISFIFHKKGMELLTMDARPINPEMPYGHRDFGGTWKFLMHDLGEDQNNKTITNKWANKGQFGAWFKYYVRPLHYEFIESFFHKREPMCIPEINTCSDDPGYPAQEYNSELPPCDEITVPENPIPEAGELPEDTFQTPPNN